jgi:hypothetical protein
MGMPICPKPIGIHLKIPSHQNEVHLILRSIKNFELNFSIVMVIVVWHQLK